MDTDRDCRQQHQRPGSPNVRAARQRAADRVERLPTSGWQPGIRGSAPPTQGVHIRIRGCPKTRLPAPSSAHPAFAGLVPARGPNPPTSAVSAGSGGPVDGAAGTSHRAHGRGVPSAWTLRVSTAPVVVHGPPARRLVGLSETEHAMAVAAFTGRGPVSRARRRPRPRMPDRGSGFRPAGRWVHGAGRLGPRPGCGWSSRAWPAGGTRSS